jgi:hypothetical protein
LSGADDGDVATGIRRQVMKLRGVGQQGTGERAQGFRHVHERHVAGGNDDAAGGGLPAIAGGQHEIVALIPVDAGDEQAVGRNAGFLAKPRGVGDLYLDRHRQCGRLKGNAVFAAIGCQRIGALRIPQVGSKTFRLQQHALRHEIAPALHRLPNNS